MSEAHRLKNPPMGTLYLVRHAQASFGADDYDQLSPLGHRQAHRLGEYWRNQGLRFDAVLTGTLRRHRETLEGISQGLCTDGMQAQTFPELNEYDGAALIKAIHPQTLPKADTPALYKQHFRLLCDALAQWMAGTISPAGMASWDEFSAGIHSVLEHIRRHHSGHEVLMVTSGGPIGALLTQILGSPAEVGIGLNMRVRNSSVTELSTSVKRIMLQTFNGVAHLQDSDHREWITYA